MPRPAMRSSAPVARLAGGPFVGTDVFRRKARNGSVRDVVFASSGYESFAFREEDYHEVQIRLVQASSDGGSQGSILLLRKEDGLREEGTNILVIGIGGDALVALITLIQGKASLRPLALDLLWQILQRGRDISAQEWQLQKVAIVRLEDGIFYGRLFFGWEEGLVVWDCDCRPSDALWLATKQGCPILVHRDVWNEASVPVESIIEPRTEEATSTTPQESKNVDPLRSIVGGDPEPIKRLKRELDVAISEEDYRSAARIRDHPFMKLYACMIGAGKEGDETERKRLEGELRNLINQQEGLSS